MTGTRAEGLAGSGRVGTAAGWADRTAAAGGSAGGVHHTGAGPRRGTPPPL